MTTRERETENAYDVESLNAKGRMRRAPEKFGFNPTGVKEEDEFEVPVGPGVKVHDMQAVAERVSTMGKKDVETLKCLYSIMYGRRFQQKNMKQIKVHILDFTGIPNSNEKTREQLMGKMGRWMRGFVQDIMDVLGVDRSKKSFEDAGKPFDKENLIHRLIDWLFNPQEHIKVWKKSKSVSVKMTEKEIVGKKRKEVTQSSRGKTKKNALLAKKLKADNEALDNDINSDIEGDEQEESGDEESDFDDKRNKSRPFDSKKQNRKTCKNINPNDNGDNQGDENKVGDEPSEIILSSDLQNKVKVIIDGGNTDEMTIVRQLSADLGRDISSEKAAIKQFITHHL